MITQDIRYIGVDDKDIDLFEGQYAVPKGISYNAYVILDEKVAVLDTVDRRKTGAFLQNLERELAGRTVDYLIVNHLEPDHASSLGAFLERYPQAKLVGNAKTFQMLPQYFDVDLSQAVTVREGDTLSLGRHTLCFFTAPMVHWP
ncbi:MAG TPA: MBL fold metallo-hydrolase, partial [Candidatus Limiplasma stercoravium]|nr:MBL fold metallo-hydrolase [Candidatus Limiplasma stercoravium]